MRPFANVWRLTAVVATLQLVFQLVNAITGLMLVRWMPKEEYALFTIATTMLALMAGLTDSGVQTGLLATAGRHHGEPRRLSSIVRAAQRMRSEIAAIVIPVLAVLLFGLLMRNGGAWDQSALIVVLVTVGGFVAAQYGVLLPPLRIIGLSNEVQKTEVAASLLRLVLTFVVVLVMPISGLVLMAVLLASFYQWRRYHRMSNEQIGVQTGERSDDRKELLSAVRMLWFPTALSAFQAHLGTGILSLTGTAVQVADFGALSRFAALFGIIGAVITNVAAPIFARTQNLHEVRAAFVSSVLILMAICLALTAAAYFYPYPFRWLLGSGYAHFTTEISMYFALSSIAVLTSLVWAMASAKLWVQSAWLIPVATLLAQVVLTPLADVGTVSGVLWLLIFSSIPPLVIAVAIVIQGMSARKETHDKLL